jgi:fido (protein-threonine AMPylation protein)
MSSSQQKKQGKRPWTEPRKGIYIGSVLAAAVSSGWVSPNIQDNDLIGGVPGPALVPATLYQTLQVITNFLTHHRLVVAASSATATTTTAAGGDTPITVAVTPAPYYLRTLEEFALAQLDRQAAGLRTNVNRETAADPPELPPSWRVSVSLYNLRMTQLVQAHTQALNNNANTGLPILLSKEKLCSIHAMLFPTDDRSGRYRTTQARSGNSLFCPPNDIDREMKYLFDSIQDYQRNWNLVQLRKQEQNDSSTSSSRVYHAMALAAMILYGINCIHPFADGNGRMARIYANFMLQELLNLPFTITLVATLQQRGEYIEGLQHGHQRLRRLAAHSDASASNDPVVRRLAPRSASAFNDHVGSVTTSSTAAVFEPLIRMLMERVAHAIVQVQALLAVRARAVDEEEARITRRVLRERAAAGQCIICLDARPNIATLCCGQAVHLNCIAKWLANGTTCVGCRSPLPRMVRPAAAAVDTASDNSTSLDPDDDDDTTTAASE